jgi:predicted AlkP superfamily phosphohydrolase/phosphomutase
VLAFIQFDSPDLSRLERLIERDRLPTLAELRRRGSRLDLRTPATHLSSATFTTLYTGLSPGDHGLYYPFQWKPEDQRVWYADAFPHPESFWDRAARAGRRVLIVDPYEAPAPAAADGLALSGWQFTNRVVLTPWSVPARARRGLIRRFGRPRAVDEVFGRPSVSRLLRLRKPLLAAPRRVADLVCDALRRESFDLAWITFPCAHLAGHLFWDTTPLEGQRLSAEERRALETTLDDVYVACDAVIAEVLEALPAGADVVLHTPLGMTRNSSLPELMPHMIAAVTGDGADGASRKAGGVRSTAWRLRSAVPTSFRSEAARLLPATAALKLTARLESPKLDWSRIRAFAVPSDVQGFVRLNLRGREREGIVDPDDADELLDELTEGLLSFHDDEGRRVVDSVVRASEAEGEGERTDWLPDLLVTWSQRPTTGPVRLTSPTHGVAELRGAGSGRSGNHDDAAWALLVPGRSRERAPVREPHIVDIATTACSLLQVDGSGLQGQPLLEPS